MGGMDDGRRSVIDLPFPDMSTGERERKRSTDQPNDDDSDDDDDDDEDNGDNRSNKYSRN